MATNIKLQLAARWQQCGSAFSPRVPISTKIKSLCHIGGYISSISLFYELLITFSFVDRHNKSLFLRRQHPPHPPSFSKSFEFSILENQVKSTLHHNSWCVSIRTAPVSWSWGFCVSGAWLLFSLFSVVSLIKLTWGTGGHPFEAAAAKQQLVHFKGLAVVSPQRQIIPHLLVSDSTRPTTLTLTQPLTWSPPRFSPSQPGWLSRQLHLLLQYFIGLQASAKTFTDQ